MSYTLNSKGYILFTQIEVGVREYLISLIKEKGIYEWSKDFLGKVHNDSIKEIGKRLYESSANQQMPNIEDVYKAKIYRELKANQDFRGGNLLHPFYYLSWAELISQIGKNSNFNIIAESLGKQNSEVVLNNLKALNSLRNDIAHSRFITEKELLFIKSSYDQVTVAIPNFHSLINSQCSERTINILFNSLIIAIDNIESLPMISVKQVYETEELLNEFTNSFWVSSFYLDSLDLINQFKYQIISYRKFRESPGGLLSIREWKNNNKELLSRIKYLINDRKISD